MKKHLISILSILLIHAGITSAQKLDNFTVIMEDEFMSSLVASDDGDFLAAALNNSKAVNIYDAKSLELRHSYAILDEIPLTKGKAIYTTTGTPRELYLFGDRFLAVLCDGGYIFHIDIMEEKVTWFKTSESGKHDFEWTGAYLGSDRICLVNDALKKIWYINPLYETVSEPIDFEDDPFLINKGLYYTVDLMVPEYVRLQVKKLETRSLVSNIMITELNANDKYNFSSIISQDNKYLLVNLYTSISVFDVQSGERILYKSQKSAYPPNIFINDTIVGVGGTGDKQLSLYSIQSNNYLGSLKMSNFSQTITANKDQLFVFRNMKIDDQFIGMLGSVPLNELTKHPGEYAVDLFGEFDTKTMDEMSAYGKE